jgi:glucose/arabinose dehydrogenase
VAETKSVLLEGLNSPFGMALIGDKPHVADTDALLRFDYSEGATEIKTPPSNRRSAGGSHQLSLTKSLVARPTVRGLCRRRVQ